MTATTPSPHFLFLVASAREQGHIGNTEWLARQAAQALPADNTQTWMHLAHMDLPAFVDLRHTAGQYPAPHGVLDDLLQATLQASDIVLVAPVYWFSLPAPLKLYLEQWSAWMRVPGLDFKERMASKSLRLVCTSGERHKAQPCEDSVRLCAEFLGMRWGGMLWGKGGAPGAAAQDSAAVHAAHSFLR